MSPDIQSVKAILVDFDGVLKQWPAVANVIEVNHGLPHGAIERIPFADPQLQPELE